MRVVDTTIQRNFKALFLDIKETLSVQLDSAFGSPPLSMEYIENKISETLAYMRAEMTKLSGTTDKQADGVEEKFVVEVAEEPLDKSEK